MKPRLRRRLSPSLDGARSAYGLLGRWQALPAWYVPVSDGVGRRNGADHWCAEEDIVFINAATGGGFGQRARANSIPSMAIPAKLSQKINRPVMMRITREEEFTIGGARQDSRVGLKGL